MSMSPGRPEAGLLTRIRNAYYEGSEAHAGSRSERWTPTKERCTANAITLLEGQIPT